MTLPAADLAQATVTERLQHAGAFTATPRTPPIASHQPLHLIGNTMSAFSLRIRVVLLSLALLGLIVSATLVSTAPAHAEPTTPDTATPSPTSPSPPRTATPAGTSTSVRPAGASLGVGGQRHLRCAPFGQHHDRRDRFVCLGAVAQRRARGPLALRRRPGPARDHASLADHPRQSPRPLGLLRPPGDLSRGHRRLRRRRQHDHHRDLRHRRPLHLRHQARRPVVDLRRRRAARQSRTADRVEVPSPSRWAASSQSRRARPDKATEPAHACCCAPLPGRLRGCGWWRVVALDRERRADLGRYLTANQMSSNDAGWVAVGKSFGGAFILTAKVTCTDRLG